MEIFFDKLIENFDLILGFLLGIISTIVFRVVDYIVDKIEIINLVNLYYKNFIEYIKKDISPKNKPYDYRSSLQNTYSTISTLISRINFELSNELPYSDSNLSYRYVRLLNKTKNELENLCLYINPGFLNGLQADEYESIYINFENDLSSLKNRYKKDVKKYINKKSIS